MKLVKGIYEQIINQSLNQKLENAELDYDIDVKRIDYATAHEQLAAYLTEVVKQGLSHYSGKEKFKTQLEIVNKLISTLAAEADDPELLNYLVDKDEILKGVYEKSTIVEKPDYPITSIAKSTLFTGSKADPTVVSELIKEIGSADRIDLLISFIKFSGLNLIYDALKMHTKTGALRIITTSYMGASDYKAIAMLAKLPNTTIKISYDTERTRLHAKAYYFHRETGFSTAYIGSSNLSKAALTEGAEWNMKVSEYHSPEIIEKYRITFDAYWHAAEFTPFNPDNIADAKKLKDSLKNTVQPQVASSFFDIKPYAYQQQILDKLEVERSLYNSYKNLVVAATGTGKTVISAFDFKVFYQQHNNCTFLFLAHRKEILEQTIATFRGVLKDNNFGDLWVGDYTPTQDRRLFASIQSLNSGKKYLEMSPTMYDYIVIDETHHSVADSYSGILNHFKPKILLGLTATPERMDGKSILPFFNDRTAYEIRLGEAIDRGLLCPFHYFGISDSTDLRQVKWLRGRYDVKDLEVVYLGDDNRIRHIDRAIDRYILDKSDMKAIGFCISQKHAKFMSDRFNKLGYKTIALDAKTPNSERERVKKLLETGELQIVFVVDLYNEGVDIPAVNTVLFLRPTESATIFIQQLGRGLRKHYDKAVLTVLDFVGQANQAYSYRAKFKAIVGRSHVPMKKIVENNFPYLPMGSFIQLERKAKEYILENIKQTNPNKRNLRRMLRNFKYETGNEPTLKSFVDYYELEPDSIYKNNTFTNLLVAEDLLEYHVNYPIELKRNAYNKLCNINSLTFIEFIIRYLKNNKSVKDSLSEREKLMENMLYYTLFEKAPAVSVEHNLSELINRESIWISEMIELLSINKARIDFIEKDLNLHFNTPLELHAKYDVDQILAGLGVHTDTRKQSFREGVLYIKNKQTDVFFITLNKSEEDFSTSTLYEDYVIDSKHFHWQSQSRTTISSPTGQRYINQKSNGNTVLLFVRTYKSTGGTANPYYYLGPAKYVSHCGEKPINIVWELVEKIPNFMMEDVSVVYDII